MDDLKPFSGTFCRMCGFPGLSYKFCVRACIDNGSGGFEDATALGSTDKPHLHRQCQRCSYEWLEKTKGTDEKETEASEATD